jgi:hypothetical protein
VVVCNPGRAAGPPQRWKVSPPGARLDLAKAVVFIRARTGSILN